MCKSNVTLTQRQRGHVTTQRWRGGGRWGPVTTWLPSPRRDHHGADHDHAQHHRQELPAARVLRHCHGPLRDCVFPVRVRRLDGVRHPQLLLQLSETCRH